LTLFVVATKGDKLKRSERPAALARMRALEAEPILCSVHTGEGIDLLRRRVLSAGR
jgi:GTP-binding protein EngB required for normal cell division